MSLQDMMEYMQQDVTKEVEERINATKINATKTLIAYGESLEQQQEDKLFQFKTQLKKKEETLKAEQDYIISAKKLGLENEFTEQLLDDIQKHLLEFTTQSLDEYKKILHSWINKTYNALNNKNIDFICNKNDQEIIKTISLSLSIEATIQSSSRISAGFIAQTQDGVIVDLSFDTLFSERKQQLLNISMQILKENS